VTPVSFARLYAGVVAWRWRLESASGAVVHAPDSDGGTFPSRADAESWLGESWRDLLESGVDQVRLFEEEREVYGPMSLHEA